METRLVNLELGRVEIERRFGRVEKLLFALFVAYLSPKVGGPDAAQTVQTALAHVLARAA